MRAEYEKQSEIKMFMNIHTRHTYSHDDICAYLLFAQYTKNDHNVTYF